MRTADAEVALERFIRGRGLNLSSIDAAAAVDAVVSWYEMERVDDVNIEDSGDMLLFQWGTYDWGEGETFQYDITRQLILEEDEDDDGAIWQLSVTLHYPPEAAMRAIGSGNQWCRRPEQAASFRELINAAEATELARNSRTTRVEVEFGQAG